MSKIVYLENAKLYKVTKTNTRKNGSVISSTEIYVLALSPFDAMNWIAISVDGGTCKIEIEEMDIVIDSKLFVKSDEL